MNWNCVKVEGKQIEKILYGWCHAGDSKNYKHCILRRTLVCKLAVMNDHNWNVCLAQFGVENMASFFCIVISTSSHPLPKKKLGILAQSEQSNKIMYTYIMRLKSSSWRIPLFCFSNAMLSCVPAPKYILFMVVLRGDVMTELNDSPPHFILSIAQCAEQHKSLLRQKSNGLSSFPTNVYILKNLQNTLIKYEVIWVHSTIFLPESIKQAVWWRRRRVLSCPLYE